jgi:hypothetical protein
VLWTHRAPILDQFYTSSCTGFALANCLNTTRFVQSRPARRYLRHDNAIRLYSLATQLDQFPGTYEPDDTGSSGLAVAKAGKQLGYLSGYQHAFGFDHFLASIALQPVIVGTPWYDGMFTPDDAGGYLRPTGQMVGGHQYLILGANLRSRYVTILNSWGPGWGVNGRARIGFADFAALLADQGDVTVPIGKQ